MIYCTATVSHCYGILLLRHLTLCFIVCVYCSLDCDIIAELSEGIQFVLKFLESVKKKLVIIFAVFLIAAVIAYPLTDYILSDSIERSLPHNIKASGMTDNFDQLIVVFDGPFAANDLNVSELLTDPDKKIMLYTPPTDIANADDVIQDVIVSNTVSESVLDIVADFIMGTGNMTVKEVLDAIMSGGKDKLEIESISDTSELIIYQTIPYEKGMKTEQIQTVGDEFKDITGRSPQVTFAHTEKGEESGGPTIVYLKPLEVPLLKLKMSAILAVIAVLPILFYMAGKEITKYVDLKKYHLKEKMPIKPKWLILIAIIMLISFILGASCSYFLMAPMFIQFLYLSAAASGAQATYSIYEFISFITMITFVFGLIFEFPIVIFILNRIGLVQKRMLTTYRRHMYVLIAVAAAVITPTTDPVSMMLLGIPMVFFYELSVLVVKLFGKKDLPKTTELY